jgi:3-phenylpropionate/trans-cinnamate dioxygenase ferredoxin reductase subunit
MNMLGKETPHDVVPYFFSDLADWVGYEYVGPGSGETVIRGSMNDGKFTVFYLGDDDAVKAALTVGRSDDLEHASRFIKDKTAPDRAELADESTDLGSL